MSADEVAIEALRRWSQILLWVAVVLPVLGGFAVVVRYYVDRHEKMLSARITAAAIQQAKNEAAIARTELIELSKKTSPRMLSVEQRKAMASILVKLKGQPVAFACRMMDGESCDYTNELAQFFLDSGCQVPPPIKTSLNDLPGYLAIVIHGKADAKIAEFVTNAFNAAGILAKIESIEMNTVSPWYNDVVHVIVGRKATEH
jgi:hypothetical protein